MISYFFIDRPIFASVVSIVIALTGTIAMLFLPVAQYPPITPPSVQVAISYPGASAQVVADTVAAPIEQQVNGVEGMLYMSSQSGNDGSYTLTVTFDLGTNLNTALVMVQNRVALANPQLPDTVQLQGITIRKKTPDILQLVNFFSPDGRYDDIYLSNFAMINIKDELLRVEGVSDISFLGQRDYSLRAWLDPQKLAALSMNAGDVAAAIQSQNIELAGGQVGQPPVKGNQAFQLPVDALGRLNDLDEFGDIIIKVSQAARAQNSNAIQQTEQGTAAMTGSTTGGTVGGDTLNGGMLGGGTTTSGITTGGTPGNAASGSPSSSGTPSTTTAVSTNPIASAAASLTSPTLTASAVGIGSGLIAPSAVGMTVGPSGTLAGMGTPVTSSSTGANSSSTSTTTGTTPGASTSASGSGTTSTGTGTMGMPQTGATSGGLTGVMPQEPATAIVRLRDVARIERGAQNYNLGCTFDGQPSVGLAIYMLPGTNALDVATRVQARMQQLKSRFPEGVDYKIAYDITPFIRESVADVVHTLFEAVALVGLVVLLFLQSWRAALIPLIAVPVAIVGTFAAMAVLHFSLNNISLFGLVLAIGIVVDDAIVVVENVERWLDHGLPPREAARRAMDEVTGPVIAIALVLCAVFVPCALIGGITGQFFRQFAVTIAVSTVFSAINSLTLSPALAAILLRPRTARRDPLTWILDLCLGWFFRLFNSLFAATTAAYGWLVAGLLRFSILVIVAYGGLLVLTYAVFARAPTGFVPDQDQGRLIVSVQLPDSASLQRTQHTAALIDKIAREIPGVAHTITVSGLSFVLGANSANFGSMFVVLDPFDKRRSPQLHANAIMAKLRREYARRVTDGQVIVFGAPPIPGLSVASGFKLIVEDRGGLGLQSLQQQTDAVVGKLQQDRNFVGSFTPFRSNTPQLYMDVDRSKVESLGVSLNDLNQTMQIYMGSLYVNSYNDFGRYWQVTLQADGKFRTRVEDVNLLQVRNKQGQMVPLGTLVDLRNVNGPLMVTRYNLYTAAPINGNIRPGTSSGEAIAAIDEIAKQTLPRSMGTEWTELMFMQIRAGNTAIYVFFLSVVFVFLALAALYESWSLPLAVILVVPLCLLCSVGGVLWAHKSVDIFVQIGLVVLVGLACKNAILIVEFAQHLHKHGQPRFEATVEACKLRLRPIIMTSLAFILGVLPLVVASGAGAEMRRSLGVAVFSGMLGVTFFGIFLTPVFFFVVQWLAETRLFAALATWWIGSAMTGGVLGLTLGFLLTQLGIAPAPWASIVGGCAGILGGLLVPISRRKIARGSDTSKKPDPSAPTGGSAS